MHLIVRTDGGARGNPGPAGIGVVIEKDGQALEEHSEFLGTKTNNQAEYAAVILGLSRAKHLGAESVEIAADSELLVKQANGEYRVKHPNIQPLYRKMQILCQQIGRVKFRHVRRGENKRADWLANQAMDRGQLKN